MLSTRAAALVPLAVFLQGVCFRYASASSSVLQRDLSVSLKERPVMKVVRLLQDMKAELEKELADDQAVHKQLACWCEENEKEKTAAIEAGEAKAEQLKASMGESAAKIDALKEKRKATMDEIEADTKSLGEATELRFKENKEFHSTETDLIEAIDAAKNAIVVLGQHHPELAQLHSVAHRLTDARVAELVVKSGSFSHVNLRLLRSFLSSAASSNSFLSIPGYRSYAPQSGQIFGILKQMKEDFEASLSQEQQDELKAQEQYEALKAAKEDEIASGKRQVVEIDASLADYRQKYAQAMSDLEDTEAQLELDQTFLANLQKKCSESKEEFDTRVQDRLEEISAVEDTIKILNNDESFKTFGKMVAPQPMFLQTGAVSSKGGRQVRQRLVASLKRAAAAGASPQLALLAAAAQLDSFTKVKEAIDKMVVELKRQQDEEITQRDLCTKELSENNRSTAAGYDKKDSLETQIADLDKTISNIEKEIESSKKSIAEMQTQMQRASDTREADNADFQETVADHRVMSLILTKALERMKVVYSMVQAGPEDEAKPGAPHIQTSGNHTDPGNAPARFTKYEKHAGGGRVVMMLEKVLFDVKKTEDQACETELDAQNAYEDLMKGLNKSIKKAIQAISDMTGAKATAEESLSMAKTDLKATMVMLEGLHKTNMDLHQSCDYLLLNFEARQAARAAEIDALGEAKAILSGMQ